MIRNRRRAAMLGAAALAVLGTACSIELGDLGGGVGRAHDVNEVGVVVGESETLDGDSHAFRRLPDGTIIDLGTLPGGNDSSASAINESGQVAGTATTPTADPNEPIVHAVRWDADGSIHDLGVIGGLLDTDPEVTGIDEAGRIVGFRATPDGMRPFVADPSVEHLVTLPVLAGSGGSYAYGMNDVGDVVGYQEVPAPVYVRPVRWDLDAWTVTDLAPTWGTGLLSDINDAGVVLGVSSQAGTTDAAILRPGYPSPQRLGIGETPIPLSINDHDVVVGYHGEDGPVVAFRWEASTGSVDLPGNDRDDGSIARSINDRGQVVGIDGPAAVFLFPNPSAP